MLTEDANYLKSQMHTHNDGEKQLPAASDGVN